LIIRILISEDDTTSRTLLAAVLKKSGHEVVETTNGVEAWAVLRKPNPPPLVILDWMMPEMDGLEVVRRVRARKTDHPPYVLLLTARVEKSDIITGLDAGADDYLTKPFHHGELRARIGVGRRLIEMQAELLKARNALAHEASHDPLTGVPNRRAIESALSRELSRDRRYHDGLAIGICDIDFFKRVNDTHGHMVGDEVLRGFASLLETHLRDYGQFGRFGGEEFLVIAPKITADGAKSMFERLRATIESTPIQTTIGTVSVTMSVGVKIVHGDETTDQLLAVADLALYMAKKTGRNRVCFSEDVDFSQRNS
jgi:two-component system, cell cycle response regulator